MSNQGKIRLLTRGDDLGSFQAANRAILNAYHNGILRNTSVMVPAPWFEQGVVLAQEVPGLCLGLHVTLNAEWDAPRWGPISPPESVPSLVDEDGHFLTDPMKLQNRGVNLEELMREVQAQLDLARARGLDIKYIDEHMGVGWIFAEEGQRTRLSERLQEFASREGLIWHMANTQAWPWHIPDLDQQESVEQFEQQLSTLQPGNYVLITHPAYDTEEMQDVTLPGIPRGKVARERQRDHDLLCSPVFANILRKHDIEVIRFDQID